MNMAESLVLLRKQHNLTQLDLAEKLGVSRQAVSRWEVGLSVPSTANLRCLSELYGVSMDRLLCTELDQPTTQSTSENSASSEQLAQANTPVDTFVTEPMDAPLSIEKTFVSTVSTQPPHMKYMKYAVVGIITLFIMGVLFFFGYYTALHKEPEEVSFDDMSVEQWDTADISSADDLPLVW